MTRVEAEIAADISNKGFDKVCAGALIDRSIDRLFDRSIHC